ncbi:MAG: hypothetical protein GY754_13655, partial [bacterium]|nr:hypothetical protein [bacterium]
IDDIFLLYHDSWGETKFEVYKNELDIALILTKIINSGLITKLDTESALRITSSHPYHATKSYTRLRFLVKDIYSFFVNQRSNERKKYITMLGNRYYLFTNNRKGKEETVTFRIFDTELSLLFGMAYNKGTKTSFRTDPTVPELNHIKTIINNFKDSAIQIYFQAAAKYSYYFISDERGSIIFFRKESGQHNTYLKRLYHFAENVIKQILEENPASSLEDSKKRVEVYKLERDIKHNCNLHEVNFELSENIRDMVNEIIPLRLSFHLLETGKIGYRFSLPDGGFSEIYDQSEILEVSKEIKTLMSSVPKYFYFPTDVNLDYLDLKMYKDFTSFSFSEKNRFELIVEKGMRSG